MPTVSVGLTDACRLVLRGAGLPMTPTDVRERLKSFGFDLTRYTNNLAAVHTTLKRLNDAGELRFIARPGTGEQGLRLGSSRACRPARTRHRLGDARDGREAQGAATSKKKPS